MSLGISIELGGSHAAIGLVNDRVLFAFEDLVVPANTQLADLLPSMVSCIHRLVAENNLTFTDFCGVGMSIAALVDWKTNRVAGTNGKYIDAPFVDLCQWSRDSFDLPLRLENDARMALLGESYASLSSTSGSVLMLTFGTGIGCAVMVDGRLFRSSQPQGGCLGGHIPVNLNGRECNCGAIGCMEAEASTWSLPDILGTWPGIETSTLYGNSQGGFRELFRAVADGDPIAEAIRKYCVRVWAVGLVGLIYTYGPSLVLLGGGVMRAADLIIPDLEDYVARHALTPGGKVTLRRTALGPHAALYGTIPLFEEAR